MKIPSRLRLFGGDGHKYTLLGHQHGASASEASLWKRKHSVLVLMLVALAGFAVVVISRYAVLNW
jgi:hypothetical protein